MRVIPHEILRYFVESDTKPGEKYLVDLCPYWGIGCCDCPHFRIRIEPHLTDKPIDPEAWRCKHIKAAREYLANQLIDTLVKIELAKENRPKRYGESGPKKLKFRSK